MLLKEKIDLWRDRFYGRQEAFGCKVTFFNKEKDRVEKQYEAQYQQMFRDRKARNKVEEGTPLGEYYIPLTDDLISGHIKGHKELLIYVLHIGDKVKFAAIDFDNKHDFDDVMRCYDRICLAHGFPGYVARSTKKGHHLYLFFDDFIEAKLVTSYMKHVYEELGMVADHQNDIKPLPETFPKKIILPNPYQTGLGIKPPMHGEGMGRNMNCWVDAEQGMDEPIGGSGESEEQWKYFNNTKKINVKDFKEFLTKTDVSIEEVRISHKRGIVPETRKRTAEYKPPKDGDFNRIIQGCPMAKRYWEGPAKDIPHDARVAMATWAMQTANGLNMLREKWQGSDKAEWHIQYQIDNYQKPWCCAALQGLEGPCVKGRDPKFKSEGSDITDYCLKKAPPKEMKYGRLVINPDNLPESEWKDPSPVRFRLDLKRVTVNGLKEDIDSLSKDDPEIGLKIEDIYNKLVLLKDKKRKKEVEEHLKLKKILKVKELKAFEKEATERKKIEVDRTIHESTQNQILNGTTYSRSPCGGYMVISMNAEGEVTEKVFTNFQIEFLKEVHIHSLIKDDVQTYSGHIIRGDKKMRFVISAEDWATNVKLSQALTRASHMEAMISNTQLDHLRFAVHLFGRMSMKIERRYEDYGFEDYENPVMYRTSKWNISGEGFSGEDDSYVDLSASAHAKNLDIKKISNEEFVRLVKVIKRDYLPFQESRLTYTTLAHSLQSTIHQAFIPMPEAPILWIQGTTGAGKTTLSKVAQSFHGDFKNLMNFTGTSKGIEYATMLFKDALLVMDDYKDGFHRQKVLKLMQTIYERSSRMRLKPNLEMAQAPSCRGLVMMTAEDKPSSEASALARCIYVEAPKISYVEDEDSNSSYRRLKENMKHFSGVTGRFLQYVISTYGKNKDIIADEYEDLTKSFIMPIRGAQNDARAAQNVSANFLTWKIFCDFLRHEMLISADEYSDYIETHRQNCCFLRDHLITACKEEQASNVFLAALSESIWSGKLRIDRMENNINDNATTVGFITDPDEFVVYIYPDTAESVVKTLLKARGASLSHSKEAIGKQLLQDGYLVRTEKTRTTARKGYRGGRPYVWWIDSKKAGIGPQEDPSTAKKRESPGEENVFDITSFGE